MNYWLLYLLCIKKTSIKKWKTVGKVEKLQSFEGDKTYMSQILKDKTWKNNIKRWITVKMEYKKIPKYSMLIMDCYKLLRKISWRRWDLWWALDLSHSCLRYLHSISDLQPRICFVNSINSHHSYLMLWEMVSPPRVCLGTGQGGSTINHSIAY